MQQKPLDKTWSLITGASSGIGLEMAKLLASYGSNVIITARRLERLEALKAEIQAAYPVRVECISGDLSREQAANELSEQVLKLNVPIQMLVNNAGIGKFGPFRSYSLADHQKSIQLNVTSLTNLSYLMVEHMHAHAKPSYILNVASLAAIIGVPNYAVYSGTKRYVRHFTEVLQYELKSTAIHVACLCPGGTMTEFMDSAGQKLTPAASKMMMTAEAVARSGIDGLLARKRLIVPGMANRLVTHLERWIPEALLMPMSHKIMSRFAYPELKAPKA